MTLTELSAAWNDLRNAALGRGTKPIVSAALATRVGSEYDAWRAFFESAGPTQDMAPTVTLALGEDWLNRYRALVTAVEAEGVKVNALPKGSSETAVASVREGVATLGTALKVLAIAAAVTVPLAAVLVLRGRR